MNESVDFICVGDVVAFRSDIYQCLKEGDEEYTKARFLTVIKVSEDKITLKCIHPRTMRLFRVTNGSVIRMNDAKERLSAVLYRGKSESLERTPCELSPAAL